MLALYLCAALGGVGIVVSRILNARAAALVGNAQSVLNNYIYGLLVSLAALVAFDQASPVPLAVNGRNFPMLLGGAIGVVTVILLNYATMRASALTLTVAIFLSQLVAGLALDALMRDGFSAPRAIGGALVLAGLAVNALPARQATDKPSRG